MAGGVTWGVVLAHVAGLQRPRQCLGGLAAPVQGPHSHPTGPCIQQATSRQAGVAAPDPSRMLILFHVLLADWIPSLRRPSWSVGRGRPVVRLYRSI